MEDEILNEENEEKLQEKGKIDEKTTVIVQNPALDARNITLEASVKRMLNARTIIKNDANKKLIEEDNINEIDLKTLLSADDNQYYQAKKEFYLRKYPDLEDDPFDLDDLHLMIMEQILQRNMLKRKKKHPFADFESQWASSLKRQGDLKKSLSMRRTDRVKEKGSKKPTVNIANLSVVFEDKDRLKELQDQTLAFQQEEEALRLHSEKVVD